jgi:magnesium transporter
VTADLALVLDYVTSHPEEVARRADQEATDDAVALVLALPVEAAAAVVARMAPPLGAECLARLPVERAAELTEALPMDVAASLLRRVSVDEADPIVQALPAERRDALRRLLSFGPDTAGAVMDPLVLVVPASATAGDARGLVARQSARLYYYLYVVDPEHRLVGVFDLAELMRAEGSTPVRDIMTPHVTWIRADSTLETLFAHPGWRDLDALPAVDAGGHFLGIIRHRRMRQLRALRGELDETATGVRTVMALGELYWLGLCGLVQGFGSAAVVPGEDAEVRR